MAGKTMKSITIDREVADWIDSQKDFNLSSTINGLLRSIAFRDKAGESTLEDLESKKKKMLNQIAIVDADLTAKLERQKQEDDQERQAELVKCVDWLRKLYIEKSGGDPIATRKFKDGFQKTRDSFGLDANKLFDLIEKGR